ncbi:MBL fold metallo-hydrolase [Pseudothermotoga thermarum]|uniref:Beta-lactamase domain-containing protein n=1 Tax=Pseudothermotoga thermarum DSM 5069 TaxID=688269 RepID=F7YW74_9THEM|nr:MBL fold metallo-hydrolase [Pseudothermotoga thermarum]AEH51846.1 beta-lactamase domain-containing protein [Pseudothermotoga thermarum DSM 5069]
MIQKINDNIIVIGLDASSNVTIVIFQEGIIIVDTSLFPEKASKIRQFVENTIKKPILYVVNTHYHPDHCFGNAAFEDLQIISSAQTANNMTLMDQHYLENLPKIEKIVVPQVTFVEEWMDKRVLVKLVGGHTPDSSIVYVPSQKLLIAGDLIFNNLHAEIVPDSDLNQWLQVLESLKKYKIQYVVPGHGPVSGESCIEEMKKYLLKILRMIEGKITYKDLLNDPNFEKRKFPELFSWAIDNLLKQRVK